MAFTHALSTNNYGPAKLIVATSAANGTHTTLATAMADAVSGDTIFLRDSVTENVTLTAGVNIAAWTGGSLNTPSITGTLTMTAAGTCNISGIRLVTNSAAAIAVTGSAASILNIKDCYLNFTNNTGITFSVANASSQINITDCRGDLGTTGIGIFTHTSTGGMQFVKTFITNTGASSTASTCSAGACDAFYSQFSSPITMSGTSGSTWEYTLISTVAQNVTSATLGGSSHSCKWCRFQSGSASALSIGGSSVFVEFCDVASSNTNAITGAGTLTYSPITFSGSSSTVNTSVQTPYIIGPKIYTTGGITFDNTSTLNVFSQGTFSPTIRGSGTAGTVTMTTAVGRYQKTGRIATVSIEADWSTLGGATGAVQCNNLPFTVVNAGSASAPSLVTSDTNNLALGVSAVGFMQPNANAATSNINYYIGSAATSGSATTITASNGFNCQLTYETV